MSLKERRSCEHCKEPIPKVVPGEHVYTWKDNNAVHVKCLIVGKFVRCRTDGLFFLAGTSNTAFLCRVCTGEDLRNAHSRRIQPEAHTEAWIKAGSPENGKLPPKKCPNPACGKVAVVFKSNKLLGQCVFCAWRVVECLVCDKIVSADDTVQIAEDKHVLGVPSARGYACSPCVKTWAPCGNCRTRISPTAVSHKDYRSEARPGVRIGDPITNRLVRATFCDTCWVTERFTCGLCAGACWRLESVLMSTLNRYIQNFVDHAAQVEDAAYACRSCSPTRTAACVGCRWTWNVKDLVQHGPDHICEGCRTYSGWGVCAGCGERASRSGHTCRDCGTPIAHYQARAPEATGFLGAPENHAKCTMFRPKNSSQIKWAHRKGCTFDGLFLGVELEVESAVPLDRVKNAIAVKRLFLAPATGEVGPTSGKPLPRKKTAIVKHDGSLAAGFEIVSGPATLDYHRQMWDGLFSWQWDKEKETRPLLSHDAPDGTCGLHVHVSRAALTWLQIGKMVQFLHEDKNRDFVRFISGRPCSNYADFMVPKKLAYKDNGLPGIYRLVQDNHNRYTALNLQNPETVEFRIFRGTLIRNTFLARIEFCHALVQFCAPSVVGLREVTADRFCAWLENKRKDYPYLVPYLAKAGWVTNNDKESR